MRLQHTKRKYLSTVFSDKDKTISVTVLKNFTTAGRNTNDLNIPPRHKLKLKGTNLKLLADQSYCLVVISVYSCGGRQPPSATIFLAPQYTLSTSTLAPPLRRNDKLVGHRAPGVKRKALTSSTSLRNFSAQLFQSSGNKLTL